MKNIILLSITFILFSCGKKNAETSTQQDSVTTPNEIRLTTQQLQLMNIKLVKPEQRALNTSITAAGKVVILSQYQASVTAKIAGTIEEIDVLEGQKISKGQKLMTVSSQEYVQLQETYLSAKSEMDYLKADYERQQSLRKDNVIGEKDFQLIKSKYEAVLSRLRSAEARLKILGIQASKISSEQEINPYYEVRSPINGFLYTLPVNLGMSVTATTELSHIVNMDKFHADIFVYEKDIDAIFEGQEVIISFANTSLNEVKGKVEFIARGIDPIKRSIIVHVVFDPPKGLVLPDMTVKATFKTEANAQLTVPSSALMQEENEHFIFVSRTENNTAYFRKVSVRIGVKEGEYTVIIPAENIGSDDMIAETGTLLLDGEMKKGEMAE